MEIFMFQQGHVTVPIGSPHSKSYCKILERKCNQFEQIMTVQGRALFNRAAEGSAPRRKRLMKTKSIDVTKNTQRVGQFLRELGRITSPIDLVFEGHIIGRIVPPGELSEQEKASIVERGWKLVQQARKRNKAVPEAVLGKVVDAAVNRVRGRK
jgi:hypothetical protein